MRTRGILAAAALAAIPALVHAYDANREVDVVLSLVADHSHSMTIAEREFQRDGYAKAFRSRDVIDAIEGGPIGCIAVNLIYFGTNQTEAIGWRKVCDEAGSLAFADEITSTKSEYGLGPLTGLGSAIAFAHATIDASGYTAIRRVIDISADGTSSAGPLPSIARDAATAAGITINGLPIVVDIDVSRETIEEHFAQYVIGGPGHLMVVVKGLSDLPAAIRRKLVLEIASLEVR